MNQLVIGLFTKAIDRSIIPSQTVKYDTFGRVSGISHGNVPDDSQKARDSCPCSVFDVLQLLALWDFTRSPKEPNYSIHLNLRFDD